MATRLDLKVKGPFGGSEVSIERFRGQEALSAPFEYELTLLSPSPDLDLAKLIGEKVTATVETAEGERHFNGYVAKTAVIDTFNRQARYQLILRPFVWMMSPRVNNRIFQNLSIPDIVQAMFREHSYSTIEMALTGSYAPREYVVQHRESDFAFVSRLMEHVGITYHFKHALDHHTIVLADAPSGYVSLPGYATVPFDPTPLTAVQARRDTVRTWRLEQQLRSGAYASTDFDFQRPKASLMARLGGATRPKEGQQEIFDYPGGFESRADGEANVRTRLEEIRADAEVVIGGGDARGLGAGTMFTLAEHPIAAQNKRHLVVAAMFEVAVNSHESGDSQSMNFRVDFKAIDAKIHFRAARTTPLPRVEGLQSAIVVGPKGEEIYTDKFGRVKVQFHWDREGKRDEKSSCWIRVAQLWAGGQWGGFHIPRIGQEVLVDFLEGDPDRPIIVGRVYNGESMFPYPLPDEKTKSGIKSRSTLGGNPSTFNELRFEDKKGSEEVYLQAEKDLEILVKHDEHRLVMNDRHKDVSKDEFSTIGGNRTESVAKDESITITGNRTETVEKNETVTITGNRSHSIEKNESLTVTGARTLTVEKDETTTVSGKQTLDVAKDQTVTVTGARSVRIGKDDLLTVTKKLLIDAGDEIIIKSGKSSITLKKDGGITIKGGDITLDASGKVNVKASGDVKIKGSKVSEN